VGSHASLKRIFTKLKNQHLVIPYTVVIGLIILLMMVNPQFRSPRNLSNILLRALPLLAVSLGQTMVLLGAGIDLSVGAIIALSTTVASVSLEWNLLAGIILVFASGMFVGLINGLGVTFLRINPFLMTLGTTIITAGVALYIRPYPGGMIPMPYVNFVLARIGVFPLTPFLLFVFLILCGVIILRKSRFGRHLYAVGGNRDAARLAGIPTNRVLIGTYVFSGFFSVFAGLYMTARICCGDPGVGASYQMDSIAAAVLGGTALTGGRGSMGGTVMGVIILAMLGNIFNLLNFNIYWQNILRGLILIVVVASSQMRVRKASQ
jgi:ribose/xylose/arabinose/galactoside ABC-type transport system permease subunit